MKVKKLYYTVEKQTQTIDTIEECSGWKNINVYEIVLDIPKVWFDLEINNNASSQKEIKNWLNDNGFGNRNYDLILL